MEQAKHLRIGRIGEDLAARWLSGHGYRIVERNFRKPYGEIDIVAQKGGLVCFCEVKTQSCDVPHRTELAFRPEDHMNLEKRKRQKRVIEAYLDERKVGEETDWRVDLICVYVDSGGGPSEIEAFEDVILA
jgi:putative endonuclease